MAVRLLLLLLLSSAAVGRVHAQTVPIFSRVFVVLEENTNYADAIGSGATPYLTQLATSYGLATQYFANTHPSIGNYLMLTTGRIVTHNDSFTRTIKADNVVRRLLAAGRTWRAYEEDLPQAGYLAPDVANYARRHCPLSYLSDVVNDDAQRMQLVPFTQFATDLANDAFPDYAFITPNLCNDAHDCPLRTADDWLRTHIDPLVRSQGFQQGGLLIVLFDEADTDSSHGGGQVAWVAVSPRFSKPGYQSTTFYRHESTLRLTLEGLGVTTFPGRAKKAPSMAEFFQ